LKLFVVGNDQINEEEMHKDEYSDERGQQEPGGQEKETTTSSPRHARKPSTKYSSIVSCAVMNGSVR